MHLPLHVSLSALLSLPFHAPPVSSQDPYPSYNAYTPKQQIHHASQLSKPPGYFTPDPNSPSIICPPGFYCPVDVTTPIPCGSLSNFCPLGSHSPTIPDKGHYTITAVADGYGLLPSTDFNHDELLCEPGYYCVDGIKQPCLAGYYGINFGRTDDKCDGPCSAGYTCPAASISPTSVPCGDPSVYCLPGAETPTVVTAGYYSTGGTATTRTGEAIANPGSYATKGVLYPCPAARFGSRSAEESPDCEGWCLDGFYCPPGSTLPSQIMCGTPDRFCPARSAAPLLTYTGYYTTSWNEECRPGRWRNTTITYLVDATNGGWEVDATNYPTQSESITPTSRPLAHCDLCPFGKYKSVAGDDKNLCVDCPVQVWGTQLETFLAVGGRQASADRTTCVCTRVDGGATFDNLHFNETTGVCESVSVDFVSPHTAAKKDGSERVKAEQMKCEKGHYCVGGVKYQCPQGHYGDTARETTTTCSGLCTKGYYCPTASTSSKQIECGKATDDSSDDATHFCPEGSYQPVRVAAGYYSNEDASPTTRSYEIECPKGYFCVGAIRYKCFAGYFGSSTKNTDGMCDGTCAFGHYCPEGSTTSKQIECGGSDVYCPEGSALPTLVSEGFYTVPGLLDLEIRNLRDVGNLTMSKQTPCLPGHWCEGGIIRQCAEGSWGHIYGMRSQSDCAVCQEGHYCPSYPFAPSTKGDQLECGSVDVWCGAGSWKPTNVSLGYYTIGGDERNTTRTEEVECEAGHYCQQGIKRACPAGTWGASTGMVNKRCSGICPAGSFCPIASVAPAACGDNEYSTAAAFQCSSCGGVAADGIGRCKDSRRCCSH